MGDLGKKARWANEAIGPANDVLHRAGRGLVDLPTDVTPGARQVAQLSAWRAAQDYAIAPVGAALEELSKLPDWTGGFLVPTRSISIGARRHLGIMIPLRTSIARNWNRRGGRGIACMSGVVSWSNRSNHNTSPACGGQDRNSAHTSAVAYSLVQATGSGVAIRFPPLRGRHARTSPYGGSTSLIVL